MPRGGRGRSGSRGGSFFGSSSPRRSTSPTQAPQKSTSNNTPTQSSGGYFIEFASWVAEGFAFGAGAQAACEAVRGLMGYSNLSQAQLEQIIERKPTEQPPVQQAVQLCNFESSQFLECFRKNETNVSVCQSYFDLLKSCQRK